MAAHAAAILIVIDRSANNFPDPHRGRTAVMDRFGTNLPGGADQTVAACTANERRRRIKRKSGR
jgi:hypothetical protein